MRLTAFEKQVRDCLPVHEETGKQISFLELCRQLGICANSLYRRFWNVPWERNRGAHGEDRFFTKLATILRDTRDKLLWLSGYNPFIAKGLSPRELYLLYEINVRIVHFAREAGPEADFRTVARAALKELASGKERNECASR